MPLSLSYKRRDLGTRKGYTRRGNLENRVASAQTNPISYERNVHNDYSHEKAIEDLIKADYFTTNQIRQIKSTSSRGELIDLGYRLKDENPRGATHIFIRTGDEKGKREMKDILFNSDDANMQGFTYLIFLDDIASLKEYGHTLVENGLNPKMVFSIGVRIMSYELAKQARDQINENDPREARKLTSALENLRKLRKTPVPFRKYNPVFS